MYQAGVAREGRTYIRWEDPVLGVNGEGRITPIIPGCQQITTVVGKDGEVLVSNRIWRTPAGMENSDENGQRGIDMTPAQPHTISASARECASCHTNPKTLGYGVEDGEFMLNYEEVCISCHQDVPDGSIFIKATAAAGELLGFVPHHDHEHMKLLNMDIKWAAMTRIFVPLLVIGLLLLCYLYLKARKKLKN